MYWNPGHQLHNNKYIIQEELGQGAFGITYKAIHSQLKLPVVIKTPNTRLRKDRNYSRYVQKFIQEAELLGQICQVPHPNIVRVIDYFNEGDSHTPCLVMEFIAGQNLFELIENEGRIKPLPEIQAINYISQIGNALSELHQKSIVHRDIHPGNIMLRRNNEPILIDFGLAGDIKPATSFSKKFGNENFAPYEQFSGVRNPTVDIYGLAATLYYAVTGETPTTSLDRKYYQANLIPPQQYNSHLSHQLNQAILTGMELEANNRPQSISDWLNLLVPPADDLSSERGIDYRKLRDFLAAGKWKQADKETYLVMLQAVGREEEYWIREEELLNFPCTDLRTIDRLWLKYSNGKFGFSVQKRIYLSVGGIADGKYYPEAWSKFGERVGWRVKGEWIYYEDVTFSISVAPTGHLPYLHSFWCVCQTMGDGVSSLVSRLVNCNI
ncbi:MAG TPA: serine/threonine-protein kinase [Nostocaceae cyanobacterium]|nr:serine/threonine-protein kinase [Nostocaceae cyanobacterium]